MIELTFAIIKPDAVSAGKTGAILDQIILAGFTPVGIKLVHLTKKQAEGFYQVHRERPFFSDLTSFMSEGPVLIMVLKKESAITNWREVMGSTNPAEATAGTIRARFGTNIERNAVHGSDSPENAKIEISYFFSELELV